MLQFESALMVLVDQLLVVLALQVVGVGMAMVVLPVAILLAVVVLLAVALLATVAVLVQSVMVHH